jgi:hypothetical protein
LLFICVACAASTAFAWNALGHRVIAEVAWQQLTPERRQEIVDTLKRHPRFGEDFIQRLPKDMAEADQTTQDRWVFWQAAVWPDVARGIRGADRRLYDRPTWHYVNGPIYLDSSDKQTLDGKLTNNMSAEYPTDMPESKCNIQQAMKHALAVLADSGSTGPDRAVAYCWLFHLVGDSHQPLHSCALFSANRFPTGDRGGNDIPLRQGRNLHSLWDNLLGRQQGVNDVKRRAAELHDRELYGDIWDNAAEKTDVRQWLSESYTLASGFVYDDAVRDVVRRATPQQPLEQIVLSEAYLTAAGGHARKRVLAAGLRLAAILDDIGETPPPVSSRATRTSPPPVSMIAAPVAAAPPRSQAPQPSATLSHWLNTNTGVRHNSSCHWFEKTTGGRKCSAAEGAPCQQCGG